MSNKHKTILLEGNAAIAQGDNEGFLKHCTDDTVWNFIGDTILNGKEAVRQWMAKNYVTPPQVTVDELIAEGELLTAMGTVTMTDASGTATRYLYSDTWRFRGDQLAELKAFVIKDGPGTAE